jgi:hypothetical protein
MYRVFRFCSSFTCCYLSGFPDLSHQSTDSSALSVRSCIEHRRTASSASYCSNLWPVQNDDTADGTKGLYVENVRCVCFIGRNSGMSPEHSARNNRSAGTGITRSARRAFQFEVWFVKERLYWKLSVFTENWASLLKIERLYWKLSVFTENWSSLLKTERLYWKLKVFTENWASLLKTEGLYWKLSVFTENWASLLKTERLYWKLGVFTENWAYLLKTR